MTAILAALRSRWTWIALGAVLVAGAAGYAAGRYAAPTKTVTITTTEYKDRTVTVWRDRVVTVQGPARIVEHVVEQPGGGRVIDRTEDRGPVTTTADASGTSERTSSSTTATTKIVEAARPNWAAEAGLSVERLAEKIRRHEKVTPLELDLALGRRILGPWWLSATAAAPTDQLGDLQAYRVGLRARMEW